VQLHALFAAGFESSSGFEKSRENLDNICATIGGDFQNFDYPCTINNYLKCPLDCIWMDPLLHHQFRFKTPRVKGLGNGSVGARAAPAMLSIWPSIFAHDVEAGEQHSKAKHLLLIG
jgi:hypothetical protein